MSEPSDIASRISQPWTLKMEAEMMNKNWYIVLEIGELRPVTYLYPISFWPLRHLITEYWLLIGPEWSRDLNTGLWLVQSDHMTPQHSQLSLVACPAPREVVHLNWDATDQSESGWGWIIQSEARDTWPRWYPQCQQVLSAPCPNIWVSFTSISGHRSRDNSWRLDTQYQCVQYYVWRLFSSQYSPVFPVFWWFSRPCVGARCWALPGADVSDCPAQVSRWRHVTWLTARDCHAALQSPVTQPRHK